MPEITANIVVEPIQLNVEETTQNLDVVVDSTNLNIYTATGVSRPQGSLGELQYYAAGQVFDGIANSNVDAGGNLVFTNLANLKIEGGATAYYLQTDGLGNLTWAAGGTPTGNGVPSGANTQIQLSDGSGAFDSAPGFDFDKASNILNVPGNVVSTGVYNGDGGGLSNIAGANVIGFVGSATLATFATTANAVAGANVSGPVADANDAIYANYANYAGNVVNSAQPNITTLGSLASLTVNGPFTLTDTGNVQEIIEQVTANATGSTGIIDFNLLDGALRLQTSNATANFGLNFVGDGSTALNTVLSTNESMTCTFINPNGVTAYIPTSIYVDSVLITPLWAGTGLGTGTPNGTDIYTFNIIKTSAAPSYQVYASRIGYI